MKHPPGAANLSDAQVTARNKGKTKTPRAGCQSSRKIPVVSSPGANNLSANSFSANNQPTVWQ